MLFNKNSLRILIAYFILLFSTLSYAEIPPYSKQQMGDKLLRGLSNISLGMLELPKNIIKISNDSNLFYGVIGGFFLGSINTIGRTAVGAIDLISFPYASKPIIYPIHPWQDYLNADTEYDNAFKGHD